MKIENITLHLLNMKLLSPFATSYGAYTNREVIIVEMSDEEGNVGWGEGVAFSTPWYTEETIKTSWHMMEDFLIPTLLNTDIWHPSEVSKRFSNVRRNNMAKAALEMAVWDVFSKRNNITLSRAIDGTRNEIEAGVAVGLQKSMGELKHTIEGYLNDGYKRVKVKIKPGMDVELIDFIRTSFPDLQLMADANSAYTLKDIEHLKRLDDYNLLMIEQPLGVDDIVDHAKLQHELSTPICLDESIVSYEDARKAIELGSCGVINIKIGRVGGIAEAKRIHDLSEEKDIPVWCGGMLETGIGRAHNIALASLSNFTIPGDISGSSRYWEKDIIVPEVKVHYGKIIVPEGPGIGFEVDREFLKKVTMKKQSYN